MNPQKQKNPMLRNVAILLVVLVGVGALAFGAMALNNQIKDRRENDPRLVLLRRDAESLSEITVTLQGQQFALVRQGNSWLMDGQAATGISAYRVDEMVNLVSNLVAAEVLEEKPTDEALALYGLTDSQTMVEIVGAKDHVLLLIGGKTPEGAYYAQVQGKREILLISPQTAGILLRPRVGYLSVPGITMDRTKTVWIELHHRNREAMVVQEDLAETSLSGLSTWKLTAPVEHPVNLEAIQNFMQSCAYFSPAEAVAVGVVDFAPYGLDIPLFTLTMKDTHGDGYTLAVGDRIGDEPRVYCRLNNSDTVYFMSSYNIDTMDLDPLSMAQSFVALVGLEGVDELRIAGLVQAVMRKESTKIVTESGTEEQVVYTLDGAPVSEDASLAFYIGVVGLESSGVINTTVEGYPELTLTFIREKNGLPTVELRFIPYETGTYAVANAENFALMTVRREDVEQVLTLLQEYRDET